MNKQMLFTALAASALLCGCQGQRVKISGRFVGNDATKVYLEQVLSLAQTVIDSTTLDKEGNYSFELDHGPKTPSLYYVTYDTAQIPLLLKAGDRITLNTVGNVLCNYTVAGSPESETLRTFYQPFMTGAYRLDKIAMQCANPGLDAPARDSLLKQYTDEYYGIRRGQLKFIVENKASLAAVYALYQRLPGDTSLANGENDVVYYRTVAEAIAQSYPESPYLSSLQSDISRMEARMNLTSNIREAGFPELELPDIYGKRVKLSSLLGKVILLDFWSAQLGTSNVLNADLKVTYQKYASAATPFEVYQVAIDTSKSLWINTVQEQQLPWISVSDLAGQVSPALGLYNVQKLPANFLIDKDGTIVAKNIYGRELEQKLDELTKGE